MNPYFKYVASATAVVGAIILAVNGISGWGWFLLVALLLA